MKKFFAIIIITVLAFAASSCNRPVTLAVSGNDVQVSALEKVLPEFTGKTGIKVVLIKMTDSTQQLYRYESGKMNTVETPDVAMLDITWVPYFVNAGLLEPLDEFTSANKTDLGLFVDGPVKNVDTYGGKLFALPFSMDAQVMFYKKKALETYGNKKLPGTMEGITGYCSSVMQKVKGKRGFITPGFLFPVANTENLTSFFDELGISKGSGIVFKENKIVLNSAQNAAAIRAMAALMKTNVLLAQKDLLLNTERLQEVMFQQEISCFAQGWASEFGFYNSDFSTLRGSVGMAEIPGLSGGKSTPVAGGWQLAVSSKSYEKEKSFKLIKFLTSIETQKKLAVDSGLTPSLKALYSDPTVLSKNPEFAMLPKLFEEAVYRPVTPRYLSISSVIQKHIAAAITGLVTPEKALSEAEKEANN
jgi:ABC-type glycerol-3-phosphate transport system substrate-binding protein